MEDDIKKEELEGGDEALFSGTLLDTDVIEEDPLLLEDEDDEAPYKLGMDDEDDEVGFE